MIRNEMIPVKLGGLGDSGESEGKERIKTKSKTNIGSCGRSSLVSRCLVRDRKLNGETKCRKDNNRY